MTLDKVDFVWVGTGLGAGLALGLVGFEACWGLTWFGFGTCWLSAWLTLGWVGSFNGLTWNQIGFGFSDIVCGWQHYFKSQ